MATIYGGVSTTAGPGISIGPREPTNVGFSPYGLQQAAADVANPVAVNATPAFVMAAPGMYFVSGSTQCTGTLPSAGAFPGGQYFVTLVNTQPMQLTGSATSGTTVFCVSGLAATGSAGGPAVTQRGDKLTLVANGSVSLQSDGLRWIPYACSGSLSMSNGGAA